MTKNKLVENYINRFRELQYKKRNNEKEVIIIALLLVCFVEYIYHGKNTPAVTIAPFIPKIKNIEKVNVVANAVEKAIDGEGKLLEYLKSFKENNVDKIDALTYIIPQKPPNINVSRESGRLEKYLKKSQFLDQSNNLSLQINKNILGKTRKEWNTQRDSRVRKTDFHSGIDGQIIDINEFFMVGNIIARYPSDLTYLPVYDVYNCRCYLRYY